MAHSSTSNISLGGNQGATDPLDVLESNTDQANKVTHLLQNTIPVPGLSTEKQNEMMQSVISLFELEELTTEIEEDDDESSNVDLADQSRRTARLRAVLSDVVQLWLIRSEHIEHMTEKLADGSRNPKWRIPLGDSGILDVYVRILCTPSISQTLTIHTLRLVGNSCADTDENRARIVASNGMSQIISLLGNSSIVPFVIPVLYNICLDYEPAQLQASNLSLTRELISLLSGPRLNESRAFLNHICKLLDLLISQTPEPELAPEHTAAVLLKIAADKEVPCDMDDFTSLVNTAIAYLHHPKFQEAVIQYGGLEATLTVLVDSYTRFDDPSIGGAALDQDEAKILSDMRSNLNQVLSDVSALPEFKETYPVVSPFSASLRRWLSSPQLQLQVCACIMLGNLARSDEACEEFVFTSRVHYPLIEVIRNTNDAQLLHAALGFLKNLALPPRNKEALGEAGLLQELPRLWALDTLQQIQYSSISLARQLIIGNFDNVRKVCKRLSEDENSPAHLRSNLSLLISLFDRTDVEPIKMEISRLITGVCRVFNSHKGLTEERMEEIRKRFFVVHPDIGRPLSYMVTQSKWPVVRSEGWFVYALMARYPESAQCISDILHEVTVFQALAEVLTGRDLINLKTNGERSSGTAISPASTQNLIAGLTPESVQPNTQAAEMARIDRENALVLVSELLKTCGKDMAVMRRSMFEDLLKGGSEIAVTYQEAAKLNARGELENAGKVVGDSDMSVQEVIQASSSEFS
ncbi:armadillo-type protein [Xylogone sp. PMI_703]|nr:armadillo-type protein [Xylogone sp. PMI_703]